LLLRRHQLLGGYIEASIAQVRTLDVRGTPGSRFGSDYKTTPSLTLYPHTGVSTTSRSAGNRRTHGRRDACEPRSSERYAFTIECGHRTEHEFWPDHDTEYPKIEREVHAALWGYSPVLPRTPQPGLGMADSPGTVEILSREIGRVFSPLEESLDAAGALALFAELGVDFPPALSAAPALAAALAQAATAAGQLPGRSRHSKPRSKRKTPDRSRRRRCIYWRRQDSGAAIDGIATAIQSLSNSVPVSPRRTWRTSRYS